MKKLLIAGCILGIAFVPRAEPSEAEIKLAKESEEYCKSTETTKATPQMIMQKMKEAVALLEKDGRSAFRNFKGKGSKFLFAGTYMWVNDYNGVMLMHPLKPNMNNQNLIGLKDSNGKRFFVDMITACKEKGSGWVDYMWPKPGEKERSLKIGYVHKAKCDGEDVVVGCGVYDMTIEEVQEAVGKLK